MAKIYSLLFSILFFSVAGYAQNVGIGTSNPKEKLHVEGAILIGNTDSNHVGTIRYNPANGGVFEGRIDTGWVKLFGGGGGGSGYFTKSGETPPSTDSDDIFHTGNVGIGASIPLAKLHIKGLGNVAIKAETANDTSATLEILNTIGMAVRAKSGADSLPAVWVISDSSIAIRAETKSDTFWAIQAINRDSAGFAIMALNETALDTINGDIVVTAGGNAALIIGDLDMKGAIRNSDPSLYGGSVAINDGLTVGAITGATCTPTTSDATIFSRTITSAGGGFAPFFNGLASGVVNNSLLQNNLTDSDFSGECKTITSFYYESTLYDGEGFELDVDFFVRGEIVGSVFSASNPPDSGTANLVDTSWYADGGWYSKWAYTSNIWNGTNPAGINWVVDCRNNVQDTDCWTHYSGTINYKWADSSDAPLYAAFGEVRASGKLYANSISEYGDVAEFFKVSAGSRKAEPGDIVSISNTDAQTFNISTKANDPLIAGVISENPSVFLNNPDEGEPIALTGRVKVKVNLESGKINAGDPITSSNMAGVGMKAKSGMIIGYALEAFDGARTDVGKIWILLARTQISDLPSNIKIVQGKNFDLGGSQISGSQKVGKNETEVFVEWDKQLKGNIPDDVDFDDLVIDLTPFGGRADLYVSKVNQQGIYVAIENKNDNFKGFYYTVDIVSSKFMTDKPAFVNEYASLNREDRIARAKEAYQQWKEAGEQLIKISGKSTADMPDVKSLEEASRFKRSVGESWQKAEPQLYARYKELGEKLDALVAGDQSIIRKMRE